MSRILISYFSDYGETMYDAIVKELINQKNDILRININGIIYYQSWGESSKLKDKDILHKVIKFRPELVLNFNHSLPKEISKSINCPNCIIDADNPETFWNKKYLIKNRNKYLYIGLQKYSKEMYKKFFSVANLRNYLFLPPATTVQGQKLKKKFNISFIGSNFYPFKIPEYDFFYSKNALDLYSNFKSNYYYDFSHKPIFFKDNLLKFQEYVKDIRCFYVGQDRLKYMSMLTDLGFHFFGVRYWNKIAYYDFEIAKCFNPKKITTLKENQWLYNSSKISVNISHPQAKSSFSWRVMDIMASNACLVMEYKPDWMKLFSKYLSKEVLDAIIYKDRYDMREKCINLLKDKQLRLKCIKECQNAIEKDGRWITRFEKLEDFTKIKILNKHNNSDYKTCYEFINRRDEMLSMKKILNTKINFRIKTRIKLIFYAFMMIINQIPIINKFLISRNTIFYKIDLAIRNERNN